MNSPTEINCSTQSHTKKSSNQNIQVYVRVRPLNTREKLLRSAEVIDVISPREIITRHSVESKLTKKFTFDRTFGPDSKQVDVYSTVVAPLIEEVLSGYNCTVFAYGQTGTGKTHTMVGTECAELKSSWEDDSVIGIIPRALCHLFDELRMMEMEFSMRISYLELYNEELCDLLSSDDSTKIRIFDDSTKKGSVIIQGLEEIPVHSKDDVYKLLEKGKERRKTATTLMNAQSSRSHTVFSILIHIRENGNDGEEMLKIGKLNLVDLAGSENVSKAGNEKGVRVRETVNINQSLLTLGRVITALVERTPHVPYRESKLTRLLQESLGGRTKTSIIATISPGHKDIDETLSTLEYAHRAKNIQNKPEVNQKLTKKVILKEYTEEIDKLKRDLMAARDKNGIYLAEETYNEMTLKMDSQHRELNEKVLLLKALKDDLQNKEKIFNEVSLNLVEKAEALLRTEKSLQLTKGALQQTKKILTTTKKRYKEKIVLLDSHVKTEEELTNQATQILQAADMATDDTHKLHITIERRKDVDLKIQKACNHFAQVMHNNFSLMNDNLSHLQDNHRSYSQIIVDEFRNAMTLQSHVVTHANKRIENVKELCDISLGSLTDICEKFKTSVRGLSDDHIEKMSKFFEELRSKETATAIQIKANLHDLESYNDELKTAIDKNQCHISHCMRRNMSDVESITKTIKEQMSETTKLADMNLQSIIQLETTISAEKELAMEEENAVKEFVQQMNAFRKKRITMANDMGNVVAGLNAKCTKVISTLQNSSANASNFCQQQCDQIEKDEQSSRKAIDDILLCIDHSVAKCTSMHMQVDNQSEQSCKLLDDFIKAETNHHSFVQRSFEDTMQEYKSMCSQSAMEITNGFADIKTGITSDTDQMKRQLGVIEGVNTSLDNLVEDYSKIYQTQMSNCSNDVINFKQSDLKTYAPTGTTPSKREYKYPRVLVATSPHHRIVKRFRQENDWSDLETTAPIDEGSDEEGLNGGSVCDISDAESTTNITPRSCSDIIQLKRGVSNGRNSLRQPQSSGSTISPRNCSQALMKENEENV